MTPSHPAAPVVSPSQRVRPLSDAEIRAALRAVHRILVAARRMASDRADHDTLAEVLDAAEVLPLSLLRPAEFDDLFRPTLDALAEKYPAFRGIRDEFVQAAR